MNFYNRQHQYYCGIDLHARKIYVCILDQKGKVMVHENIKTDPEAFIQIISPYVDDIIVGADALSVLTLATEDASPNHRVVCQSSI